jgi:hypothetical protein
MLFISNEVSTLRPTFVLIVQSTNTVLRLDEYLDLNFELDGLVEIDLYLKFIYEPI